MAKNLAQYLKLFTFCALAVSAKAQTPVADSLKNLLDYSPKDTPLYLFNQPNKKFTALKDSMQYSGGKVIIEDIEEFYKSEQQAQENETLRMKLEMQEGKTRLQQLAITFAILILFTGSFFTFILYRSRRQIRKRNKLLSEQNNEIQAQNEEIKSQQEEITMQAEQLTLRNEFLIRQNQQLKELNQEKDGLIGIVAHDLRTPLNQSKGFAELLKHSKLDADQLALVKMITRVNDDGLHLIQDLLQINALDHESLQLTSVLLDHFIHNSVEKTFKPLAEKKGIALHIAVEEELTIRTDPAYLKRILENLVSNALKFSFAGSSVFLRILSSNESIYISVEDQGPGISEDDQKKMFRRFQKLSARPTSGETSTGLGLSIVKGLVEKLRGELKVKSELGKGTSFIIKLNKSFLEIDASFHILDKQLEG
jgi:signal transduction histidine kinase